MGRALALYTANPGLVPGIPKQKPTNKQKKSKKASRYVHRPQEGKGVENSQPEQAFLRAPQLNLPAGKPQVARVVLRDSPPPIPGSQLHYLLSEGLWWVPQHLLHPYYHRGLSPAPVQLYRLGCSFPGARMLGEMFILAQAQLTSRKGLQTEEFATGYP